MTMKNQNLRVSLIEATAMALYVYNVSPGERAERLYRHFEGACADPGDLLKWVDHPSWATQMPWPTAQVYMQHAMERYGTEARERVYFNSQPTPTKEEKELKP